MFVAACHDDSEVPSSAGSGFSPAVPHPYTPEIFSPQSPESRPINYGANLRNTLANNLIANIPDELKLKHSWVTWKIEEADDGKTKKVPYSPATNRYASVTRPDTWVSFNTAETAVSNSDEFSGAGFVFNSCDGYVGIDLDHCRIGEMNAKQQAIYDALKPYGYCEISPSGNGIHIIVAGTIPRAKRIAGIEIYANARFFTVTGNVISPGPILNAQPALDAIYSKWSGADIPPQSNVDQPQLLDDRAVYDKAANAVNGSKFQTLWAGNWNGGYPSQSEADQALVNFLCHHSPNDSQCIGMFRQSGLGQREKAQRDDYATGLIKAARIKPVKLPDVSDELRRNLTAEWEAIRGNAPAPAPVSADEILPTVDASSLAGQPIPQRYWLVENVIPGSNVTLLYGNGGDGKSLLALQLAVAARLGRDWLGWPVSSAVKVLGLFAEDDLPELHRRLVLIAHSLGVTLRDLAGLVLAPLAGVDALLAAPRSNGATLQPTALFAALVARIAALRPGLLIIDTLADAFGGNEIDRAQVRQFVGMLRKLAIEYEMAVFVLAHPSQSGITNKTGTSGSTAWSNSVRSRLYLSRYEPNPEIRTLEIKKANYAATGNQVRLEWRDGIFVTLGAIGTISEHRRSAENDIDELFIELLSDFEARRMVVSPQWQSRSRYVAKLMEDHPKANGVSAKAFYDAMIRLKAAGRIAERFERINRRDTLTIGTVLL